MATIQPSDRKSSATSQPSGSTSSLSAFTEAGHSSCPELLAPAGHVESFMAAIENGADAVYLGLKSLSARVSATNFSLDDLSILTPYAHKRHVSIYVALNSLVPAPAFSKVLDLLQSLFDLKVNGLIVQDPGIMFLARRFFPQLELHASTLMTIHNSAGVRYLQRMGFKRVVLARELTIKEIEQIASATEAELEIFVHGALCYSYSGMCLASSFRGGHSGLMGQCVQPCRLALRQGQNEGYFLSCNDLCSLALIPELKKLPLSAFKIEGRMKSADYIARVVKAYRLVMDAPADMESEAIHEAMACLSQAPSRRLTGGYLKDKFNSEVLTPHRSGSSGLWVATVKEVHDRDVAVDLRHDLHPGDRLRPEARGGKEKPALTVSDILSFDGGPIPFGRAGDRVALPGWKDLLPGDRLFRIGTKTASSTRIWNRIRGECGKGLSYSTKFINAGQPERSWTARSEKDHRSGETLIIKIGGLSDLARAFRSKAQRVILTATRSNLERLAKQHLAPVDKKRLIWSLPTLLPEKELGYYYAAVKWYMDKGFTAWEVNNWSHFDFFQERRKGFLISGHRFNVRNSGAMSALSETGCNWSVLSLEITAKELEFMGRMSLPNIPIISLYAWPPLFISRLTPKLKDDKPLITPHKETLLFRRRHGHSCIYADRPINWCEQLPLLRSYGFRHFLLDLSDGPDSQTNELERVLNGCKASKSGGAFSLFNWNRKPI